MGRQSDATVAIQRGPFDPWLLVATVLLVLIGEVMVFNTTYFYAFERFGQPFRFVWKHQVAIVLGTLGLVVAASLPSSVYRRLTYPALAVAFFGLLVVLVPGVGHGDVHRWIAFGPLNFQPSELAKGAIALYLAHSLTRKAERISDFWYGLLPHLLIVGFGVGLDPSTRTRPGWIRGSLSFVVCSLVYLRRASETSYSAPSKWSALACARHSRRSLSL